MTYEIRTAGTAAEKDIICRELTENLRQIDREEMEGLGFTVEEGVSRSIYGTNPVYYVRLEGGKLAICYGLNIFPGKEKDTYLIWALATDELQKAPKSFVKESSQILRRWADTYGELTNTVGTFNRRAVAWLKSLGAVFDPPRLINGKEYATFYLRKKEEE